MLLLSFRMGDERYALDASEVVEITPLVQLRKILHAPGEIAGIFNYRGNPIPVLDLAYLIQQRPCQVFLSTRIILIKHIDKNKASYIIGIMAEQVSETTKRDESEFTNPGVMVENAPYLTAVANDSKGMIQFIDLSKLISETAIASILFSDEEMMRCFNTSPSGLDRKLEGGT